MTMTVVEWDEVEPASKRAFNVWLGQPESAWASRAWQGLAERGLTQYDDECERYGVLLRFLAMAGIYHDFCAVAWDEVTEREYGWWAEPLDLSAFVIGQLYGRQADWEPLDSESTGDAITALAEAERDGVVKALLAVFGGTNGLYESLWRSRANPPPDEEEEDSDDERTAETELVIPGLIEGTDPWLPVTAHRQAAFEWVSEGCPSHE